MRFTCNREILLKEISIAQEIISSKNAISIWSNICLNAKDDRLVIKATDRNVNFETEIPVTVIEQGSPACGGCSPIVPSSYRYHSIYSVNAQVAFVKHFYQQYLITPVKHIG